MHRLKKLERQHRDLRRDIEIATTSEERRQANINLSRWEDDYMDEVRTLRLKYRG